VSPRAKTLFEARKNQGVTDVLDWVTNREGQNLGLKFFDDVGQIYEIQLAKMEFTSLPKDPATLKRRLAYFEEVLREKTHHYYLSSVRGKGQIGHTNQYLTHWFYPYKGKFHGQMIKAILNFMGVKESSLVLDPFVGSGTTLIECATLGVPSVGVDINPALCVVSQIKCDALSLDYPAFEEFVRDVTPARIFRYFHRKEMTPLWHLTFSRLNYDAKDLIDEAWERRFQKEEFKSPIEWRSLLMLVYLHALSDYTYLKGTNKERTLEQFFMRDLEEYSDTVAGTFNVLRKLALQIPKPRVVFGDALHLPMDSNSVDGIVTSPPYSIALDYVRNDQHLLDYLGIDATDLRQRMVGLKGNGEQKIALYDKDIRRSLIEMARVLKPGCWAAIVLGDVVVAGIRTNFCDRIIQQASDTGFSEAWALKRPILGGYARLRYEYVVMLRK